MFSPQPWSGSTAGGGGWGGWLCIHPQVIVTVEGSMGIVTMQLQGKQIPCSSSVGLLGVKEPQNAKLQGWMWKFRLPVAWNSSAIMHAAGSLTTPAGGREWRVQAADGDLAAEPRSTSGPCCVDFSKKYRWTGNVWKKKNSPYTKDTEER